MAGLSPAAGPLLDCPPIRENRRIRGIPAGHLGVPAQFALRGWGQTFGVVPSRRSMSVPVSSAAAAKMPGMAAST